MNLMFKLNKNWGLPIYKSVRGVKILTIIILSKVLGTFVTIWGLGIMLNASSFKSILTEMDGHKLIHVLIGMIFTLLGTYVLCVHHVFDNIHAILITFLGYVFFIHGSFMLLELYCG